MWKKIVVLSLSSSFLAIYILKKYFGGNYCNCKGRLDGKVIIITGATSGIGKETAAILASKGANLVLACRDVNKGEEVTSEIKQKTGNPLVRCERLDLSSFQSIIDFVNRFKRKESNLYGLLNNAGLFHVPFQQTENGFDVTLQTNFLGPFLLTYLLIDSLKQGVPSRIVNLGSESHWYPTHMDVSKLTKPVQDQDSFDKFLFYGTTKLCLMLLTTKLSKLLAGTFKEPVLNPTLKTIDMVTCLGSGVTVNSVNPGNVKTSIHRHFPGIRDLPLLSISRFLVWLTFKTPYQGAQTSVHLLSDPSLSDVTGIYFSDCAEKGVSSLAKSSVLEEELWEAAHLWLHPFLVDNVNREVEI